MVGLFTMAAALGELVIAQRTQPKALADQVGIDPESVLGAGLK